MKSRYVYLAIVLSLFFQATTFAPPSEISSQQADAILYNEVYDANGNVRPQYKEAVEHVQGMSKTAVIKFIREAKRRMSKDTPIAPLPRIFTQTEYDELKAGTEQRAKAIQMFLEDHYSGKQSYRDKVVPGQIIDMITSRTGEGNYYDTYRKMKKGDRKFRFLYGPDIIRAADPKSSNGYQWLVLEDNLGFVGGTPGDTIPSRQTWEALSPELKKKIPFQNHPHKFLTELMDRMHDMATPKIGFHDNEGAMVMLASPPYGDNEDVRMADEFTKRGVVLVTPHTAQKRKDKASKKLVVRDDGVYLQERSKYGADLPERRVGMLWLNAEHAWVDWSDPLVYEKALMEEARDYLDEKGVKHRKPKIGKNGEIITHSGGTKQATKDRLNNAMEPEKKTGRINVKKLEAAIKWAQKNDFAWTPSVVTHTPPVPGLLKAIMDGRVQSNYMPGTEFVGDKMFHSYIPQLIRFYGLGEPILQNPQTERFFEQTKKGAIERVDERIDQAMSDKSSRVVKVVDGRGGDGIHIGPKMSPEEWQALAPELRQEFVRYVDQKYHHPSIIDDGTNQFIVDHRMFSYVDENGTLVSNTPWSRSRLISRRGENVKDDGKVNMSTGNGTLALVAVVPTPKKCARATAKFGTANKK